MLRSISTLVVRVHQVICNTSAGLIAVGTATHACCPNSHAASSSVADHLVDFDTKCAACERTQINTELESVTVATDAEAAPVMQTFVKVVGKC